MFIPLHVDNKKLILVNEVVKSVCPYCKTHGDIRLYVAQPYVRLFFIPGRPLKKEITAICLTCDEKFSPALFTENLKQRYEGVKKRAPWWMYSGITFCIVVIVGIFSLIIEMKREEAIDIQHPGIGDLYTLKLAEEQFTLLKVTAVKGDSVSLVQNQYVQNNGDVYNSLSGKPYFKDVHTVHKKQLTKWYDNHTIVGVYTAAE